MSGLREALLGHASLGLAGGGFLLGALFGALVEATGFCAMGGISDMVLLGDRRRLRAWVLAAAIALLATQALAATGVVGLEGSIYLRPRLAWFGHLAGGLLFGFGMVLAGGCASRNLARAGAGDLASLLAVVVVGLAAHMAMGGVLGPLRAGLEGFMAIDLPAPSQGIGDLLAGVSGLGRDVAALSATVAIGGAALAWCLCAADFRRTPRVLASGIGVGLIVATGWALTGLAHDVLSLVPHPPQSLTFVRPAGDTLDWLARFTADPLPGFGVASVLGTLTGAGLSAQLAGRFRLATFADVGDTVRVLAGAALMGFGGVLALGCTLGQAVTGVSSLAAGGFITFVSLVLGGVLGVHYLSWRMDAGH